VAETIIWEVKDEEGFLVGFYGRFNHGGAVGGGFMQFVSDDCA
jgi:hypothetical protein